MLQIEMVGSKYVTIVIIGTYSVFWLVVEARRANTKYLQTSYAFILNNN